MALSNGTLNINNGSWKVNVNGSSDIILNTANKFMDRDIVVSTPAGEVLATTAATLKNYPDATYPQIPTTQIANVPSGQYLVIKEGYHTASKISLAQLVPDAADLVAGESPYILQGHTAYDKNGQLITGALETIDSAGPYKTDYFVQDNNGQQNYPTASASGIIESKIGPGNIGNTYFIKKGSISRDEVSPHVTNYSLSQTDSNNKLSSETTSSNISLTSKSTAPSSGYYFTVQAGYAGISDAKTTVLIDEINQSFTPGWISSANIGIESQTYEPTVNVAAASKTLYYALPTAVASTTSNGAISYTGNQTLQPSLTVDKSAGTGDTNITLSNVTLVDNVSAADKTAKYYFAINSVSGDASTNVVASSDVSEVNISEGYVGKNGINHTVDGATGAAYAVTSKGKTVKKFVELPKSTESFSGGALNIGGVSATIESGAKNGVGENVLTFKEGTPSGNYWAFSATPSSVTASIDAVTYNRGEGYTMAATGTAVESDSKTATKTSKTYWLSQTTYSADGITDSPNVAAKTVDGVSVPGFKQIKVATAGYDYKDHVAFSVPVYQGAFQF